jgi:ubiquinone/menaquinone biosynthesis C-methylase UbiE
MNDNKDVLDYWNDPEVESMYDKHLIRLEIDLIKSKLTSGAKVLDVGCGEGEGTLEYSKVSNVEIYGADFSDTRLEKAKQRLIHQNNVKLFKIDFLDNFTFDCDFDFIISQRFLINLLDFELQKEVILKLSRVLKKGGKLILLEGSVDGVNQLNDFRQLFGLEPIPVRWHNLFFNDVLLENYFSELGLYLIDKDGLGEYFMLTRAIRAYFDNNLNWDSPFNEVAAANKNRKILNLRDRLSRLKIWTVEKQ